MITDLQMEEKQKKRMIDLGFYVGNTVYCDRISPGESLMALLVNDTVIALRMCMCKQISITIND